MAKIRFSLVCNIIAAICFAVVGFGDLHRGEVAVACLFLGLFVLQIVMIVFWIRKIRNSK